MADTIAFAGSIPALYDQYLGPLIFEPYATDLARRVALSKPKRVLEVACGTGRVTRQLAAALPEADIVATDLSLGMLEFARGAVTSPRITWQEADAMALPFADGGFDAVVCQFGLMFLPDPSAGLREMARVTAKGGSVFASTWDSFVHNAFGRISNDVILAAFPVDPPRFMQIPFSLHDTSALESWTINAGYTDVVVAPLALEGESPTARDAARGFVRGNPVAAQLEQRGGDLNAIEDQVTEGLAAIGGTTPLRLSMRAIIIHGRRG